MQWRPLVYGIVLPIWSGRGSRLVLGESERQRGFVFAPLGVFQTSGARLINPARRQESWLKLVLSILFPLAVYWCALAGSREATPYLNLAWLTFAARAAYSYLPGGGRRRDGASWQLHLVRDRIAVFVLFVASAVFPPGLGDARRTPAPEGDDVRASPSWGSCSCCIS